MCRGEYLYIERGRLNCSGIMVSMASALSETTDIRPKSARYIGKALFAWYAMHALGAGEKCCWVPEVIYLGSD